jgi:hypothetical protein
MSSSSLTTPARPAERNLDGSVIASFFAALVAVDALIAYFAWSAFTSLV